MAVPDLQDAIDCLQRKDVDGAIATLERKVDELPAHLTAHVLLARAHEAKRQWDRALTCWENVYFLMPNSPVAREGKRRVLRKMDRGTEADDIEPVGPAVPDRSPPAGDEATGPEPDEEGDEEAPTTATEAVSELDKLRRQAEEEARRGGARAELSDTPDASAKTTAPASPPAEDSPAEDASGKNAPDETPEERVSEIEDEGDDLDRLIDELESARIEPSPDVDDVPAPNLDQDVDDLVSETLARIHEAQDQYRKAAQIYVKLASQEPDQARTYLEKAAEMRRNAERDTQEEDS
jgi:tetratricopeptide (TPR) repeat protein